MHRTVRGYIYFRFTWLTLTLLALESQACVRAGSNDSDSDMSHHNTYQSQDNIHRRVVDALAPLGELKEVDREEQSGWLWTESKLFDETYPLTVDVLASTDTAPDKIIYFFPGGATNFHASYFIPHDHNIAHYFREHGYAVVGITAREESVPADVKDLSFSAGWGISKHRSDVRRVIEAVQAALGLPYEVLGHSYGGSLALDYGAKYSNELQRLLVLDIYSFDPAEDTQSIRNAERTRTAYEQLLGLGEYADTTGQMLAALATWSDAQRKGNSGIPRALFGNYRGNFTNEASYYLGLIETAALPGASSLFTDLASDWPMVKGICAGTYTFADDPKADTYSLTHVSDAILVAGSRAASSGIIPSAFSRDYWSAVAGDGVYNIDWSAIQCPLVWLNTQLGYAEKFYGALAARAAGNARVSTGVIEGYGHSDIFWGRNAATEVWPKLIP